METLITNVTDGQKKQVKRFAEDAVDRAVVEGVLDKDGIQKLIENGDEFQADIIVSIKKHSFFNQFADEEVESSYEYLSGYRKTKGMTEQVNILRQLIPGIGNAFEKLAEQPLPGNAEGWFAIPRWQSVGKTYEEALQKVLNLIREQRGSFYNYREGQLGAKYLRKHERTIKKLETLCEAQKGYDILVIAAQFGLRHRGKSVRRAREVFMGSEFGLGAFEIACMILTHQERLANYDNLYIDCAGDEYAPGGDGDFSNAPYFIFVDGEVRFGPGFVGIASGHFGSASAFLPQ